MKVVQIIFDSILIIVTAIGMFHDVWVHDLALAATELVVILLAIRSLIITIYYPFYETNKSIK